MKDNEIPEVIKQLEEWAKANQSWLLRKPVTTWEELSQAVARAAWIASARHFRNSSTNDYVELKRDAERYRWLRELDGGSIYAITGNVDGIHSEQLDETIDHAMAKEAR